MPAIGGHNLVADVKPPFRIVAAPASCPEDKGSSSTATSRESRDHGLRGYLLCCSYPKDIAFNKGQHSNRTVPISDGIPRKLASLRFHLRGHADVWEYRAAPLA